MTKKITEISEIVMVPSFFATTPFPIKQIRSNWLQRQNNRYITTFVSHNPKGEIPYGTYARQLLIHFITEAELTKTTNINIKESLTRFRKNFSRDGKQTLHGSRVNTELKNQIDRLKYLALTEERLKAAPSTSKSSIIYESAQFADQLIKANGKDVLNLSSTFLLRQGIQEKGGPFPCSRAAVINLGRSCLALDFYFWATRRNYSMRKQEEFFTWAILWEQFTDYFSTAEGTPPELQRETKHHREMAYDFKKRLKLAVSNVKREYILLNVKLREDGLVLIKSKPHIAPKTITDLIQDKSRNP